MTVMNALFPLSKCSSLAQLQPSLSPESAETLRQLCHVLKAPIDIPCVAIVANASAQAVRRYGATLGRPSGLFILVQQRLDHLAKELAGSALVQQRHDLDHPLYRRLIAHAPWALLLTLACGSDKDVRQTAAGVEIALSLAVAKIFPNGFANEIRKSLSPELFGMKSPAPESVPAWQKQYLRARVKAARLFDGEDPIDPNDIVGTRLFDVRAGQELSRKSRYAAPRHRQAALDRRHQTAMNVVRSAAELRHLVESGDSTAALTVTASLTGLTLALTLELPLIDSVVDDKWVMVLDVKAGQILTCLEKVFPNAAQPKPNQTCLRPATRVVVKPLPKFLAAQLRKTLAEVTNARSLADLVPGADISGCRRTMSENQSAISPTAKRFLNSTAPFAITMGVDRLSAALISNDFGVIPSSKLYYCWVEREELWNASARQFISLGWGDPDSVAPGLPFGSRVVPTREAIMHWHQWMKEEVGKKYPGRNSSLARVISHHNQYARACASLAVFCVGAREAKQLHFTSHNLYGDAQYGTLLDKQVGQFPAPLPVPICHLLREQLKLWLSHCAALERRLLSLGGANTGELLATLKLLLSADGNKLFFEIGEHNRVTWLGSADLVKWWPRDYPFDPDVGRHFWQVELKLFGVASTTIDLFARHMAQGIEAHKSTSHRPLARNLEIIARTQNLLLDAMEVTPIPGLSKNNRSSQ